MEEKLKEYRALRRRREIINNAKEKIDKSKEKIFEFLVPTFIKNMNTQKKEEEVLLLEDEPETREDNTPLIMEDPIEEESETIEAEENIYQESMKYFITKWSIYTMIWLTLYLIFLKLQFGAVFFIISALIGIFLNTRTKPKRKDEVSAYSVFNPKCKSIDGTLKAEQFEREIRFGAASVR